MSAATLIVIYVAVLLGVLTGTGGGGGAVGVARSFRSMRVS